MAGCCGGGSKKSKCGTTARKEKAPAQCAAKTAAGTRCKRMAPAGAKFCSSHSK